MLRRSIDERELVHPIEHCASLIVQLSVDIKQRKPLNWSIGCKNLYPRTRVLKNEKWMPYNEHSLIDVVADLVTQAKKG